MVSAVSLTRQSLISWGASLPFDNSLSLCKIHDDISVLTMCENWMVLTRLCLVEYVFVWDMACLENLGLCHKPAPLTSKLVLLTGTCYVTKTLSFANNSQSFQVKKMWYNFLTLPLRVCISSYSIWSINDLEIDKENIKYISYWIYHIIELRKIESQIYLAFCLF